MGEGEQLSQHEAGGPPGLDWSGCLCRLESIIWTADPCLCLVPWIYDLASPAQINQVSQVNTCT